jgi:hypothetical protein
MPVERPEEVKIFILGEVRETGSLRVFNACFPDF